MMGGSTALPYSIPGRGWLSGLRRVMDSKWLGGNAVAWLALGATLIGNAITFGATVASTQGRIDTLDYQVKRNREEAHERIKLIESSISHVYTALAPLNSIRIDVEVIKEQIKSVNGALLRMERGTQRGPN